MVVNTPKVVDTESSLAFGLPSAEEMLQRVSRHCGRFADHGCRVYAQTQHRAQTAIKSLSTAHVTWDFCQALPYSSPPFPSPSFLFCCCSHPKGSPGSPELPGKPMDCASPLPPDPGEASSLLPARAQWRFP